MARLRVLLTGREGQLGAELYRALQVLDGGRPELLGTDRRTLDLYSDAAIEKTVDEFQPNLIVNAAAYTAVDRAESEPEVAGRINAGAVAALARAARQCNAALIHYSTEYVFNGDKAAPYCEEDEPDPLNAYGRSKLAGEKALAEAGIPHLILRTSWVYGSRGKNFLLTILKLTGERPELRVVNDQLGAPTWSRDIARATAEVAGKWLVARERDSLSGIYHLTASGSISWFGFASEAVYLRAEASGETLPRLVAIPSAEYPTAARRPKNSQMDCTRLQKVFGVRLPRWDASLKLVMDEILGAGARAAAVQTTL